MPRSPGPEPVSQPAPGHTARQPRNSQLEGRPVGREARQEPQAREVCQRVQLVCQHLLERASDRQHRAALRLLPPFRCLGLRESCIIGAVRSQPARF